MSEEIVARVRLEISKRSDPDNIERVKRFFKEPILTLGLTSPMIKEVAELAYPSVKGDLHLAIEVAGKLMSSGVLDEASVAIQLMGRMTRLFTPATFDVLDAWVDSLTNWANTDGLAAWLVSATVRLDPSLVNRLLGWTRSENRWRRRAAAVSLVPIVKRGELLTESFTIAERLMADDDEMVQKGVGWLLKDASLRHPDEVRDYLLGWRDLAPALVLRYASERFPQDKKVLKTR